MLLIVPYRDREENLKEFLEHYKGFKILIVEQSEKKLFNRAKLCNIGFNETKDNLVCFHDVDLLAEDLTHYKEFKGGVNHFSGLCEQFNYKEPYATCLGGVTAFDSASFLKCNGFSNTYWGWGGEDDDLYNRVVLNGISVEFSKHRYFSLNHKKQEITDQYKKNVKNLSNTSKEWKVNGLNSLRYQITEVRNISDLVTKIIVNL